MAILADFGPIRQHTVQVMHHSQKCHSRDVQEMQNCLYDSGLQTDTGSLGPTKVNICSDINGLSPNPAIEVLKNATSDGLRELKTSHN